MFGLFSKKIETCNTTGCENPPTIEGGYSLKCSDCKKIILDAGVAKRTNWENELNCIYDVGDRFCILGVEFMVVKYKHHMPSVTTIYARPARIYVMECYYINRCGDFSTRTFDHSHIEMLKALKI